MVRMDGKTRNIFVYAESGTVSSNITIFNLLTRWYVIFIILGHSRMVLRHQSSKAKGFTRETSRLAFR